MTRRQKLTVAVSMVGVMGLVGVLGSLEGCSGTPERSPSDSQVRKDSDRFFDKMKDDERPRQ